MSDCFVDTDVIIRLLTGDDPQKQAQAATFFEQVEKGSLTLVAPVTVIADCVYVLSSPRLYNLPRTEVVGLLTPLLRLPHFRVQSRRTSREPWTFISFTGWTLEMPSSSLRWNRRDPKRSIPLTRASIG